MKGTAKVIDAAKVSNGEAIVAEAVNTGEVAAEGVIVSSQFHKLFSSIYGAFPNVHISVPKMNKSVFRHHGFSIIFKAPTDIFPLKNRCSNYASFSENRPYITFRQETVGCPLLP